MKNYQITRKVIMLIITLILLVIPSVVNAKSNDLEQKLKVLIIEINPWLETKGMKAADYLNMSEDTKLCVDELIEDIEYSSHGNVDVEIVKTEWLNEFCTYKAEVNLLDGSTAHRFDEETWLDIMKDGWYGFWDDPRVKAIGAYKFDVEYILDKYDLVRRRNEGEFNQLWLVNVDPAMTYEAMMVGKTAYWLNGYPIIKNCENFAIMNVSISRRDANLECFGHMTESIMKTVFKSSENSGFPTNKKQDKTYEEMNLWEKFTFNKSTYTNDAKFYGVGNMHFSPNSEFDYDWKNKTKVLSTWKDWLYNYPDLKNTTVETNYTAYDKDLEAPCRNHHRWWFYLFPHVDGVTDDGYSNNWWDYFVTLDYVKELKFTWGGLKIKTGREVPKLYCKATYQSGKQETIEVDINDNNFILGNENCFKREKNKLIADGVGETEIYYYLDGVCASMFVSVIEDNVWINSSDWAVEELKDAYEEDLIPKIIYDKDYTDNITREQFAAISVKLYERISGKIIENVTYNPFIDTTNPEVLKAYYLGITNGVSETQFSPKTLITREQMATMINRVLAVCDIDNTFDTNSIYTKFDDHSEISGWAIESVYFMASNNIIKGMDDNNFVAKGNATIEQAVIIANRCVKNRW